MSWLRTVSHVGVGPVKPSTSKFTTTDEWIMQAMSGWSAASKEQWIGAGKRVR